MSISAHSQAMRRKPILMPADMIEKVDKIAARSNVSFAEVVRGAVKAFDSETLQQDEENILNALADTMIETTRSVIKKMKATEKRLDKTHAILEANN